MNGGARAHSIVVTYDLEEALVVSDYAYVISDGEV